MTYIKIKMVPDGGMDNFNISEATAMAGADPDYLSRRLWKDINEARYPSWAVYAQLFQEMDVEHDGKVMVDPIRGEKDIARAKHQNVNIFDATRTVPERGDDDQPLYPFRKFGRIVLKHNPKNAFAAVEQAAFSPANVVPGWDISPDPSMSRVICWPREARLTSHSSPDPPFCVRRRAEIQAGAQRRPIAHESREEGLRVGSDPTRRPWDV